MLSLDSIVSASRDQVSCDLAGEAAILNTSSGVYYGLNPVGAFIWNLIQQPRPVRDICSAVLQEFDVDAERCEHDLRILLVELAEQGLIEISEPSSIA